MISRRPPLLVLVRLLPISLSTTTTTWCLFYPIYLLASIDLNDFLRVFKQMKVDGDRIVFSDTATDPGTSPSKVSEELERPNSRKRRSPPSAEPSAKVRIYFYLFYF